MIPQRKVRQATAATLGCLHFLLASCGQVENMSAKQAAQAPAASGALPYYSTKDFTPHWIEPSSRELATFHTIPAFSFTNQDGKTITNETYRGKIYVSSFFFANCPGICATIVTRLKQIEQEFAGDDEVRLISHSITPEADTVPVLRAFARVKKIRSDKWDLVTGDREKIYDVAKRGYFASEDLGRPQAKGDFTHTGNVLLIDRNGRIRGIYNGMSNAAMFEVIADIKKLKAEPIGG